MFRKKEIITAVEIGTSKLCVLIGESDDENGLTVLGHGERSTQDHVSKGEIINMKEIGLTLHEVVEEAERQAKQQIDIGNVFAAVTGNHIKSQQGVGSIIINDEDRIITQEHVDNVIHNAKVISLPPDKTVFNTFDSYFVLDQEEDRILINPLEQVANKLVAVVHIIYGSRNRINGLNALFNKIGFDETNVEPVFSGIASSFGILNEEELEKGVLLIDLGAGTTEYVLIHNLGIYHSGVFPVGCEHIANDLFVGLDLSISICRKMLTDKKYNHLYNEKDKAMVEINSSITGKPRKIPLNSIEKIIDLRVTEIFGMIRETLDAKKLLSKVNAGIVLTGGGAMIPMASESLRSVFNAPVKIGFPQDAEGVVTDLNDPRYSTVWGVLKYGEKVVQSRMEASPRKIINRLDRFSSSIIRTVMSVKDAIRI